MLDHPEKYPLTPAKGPIENPYYVPKPVSIESLKLMQNLSKSKSQKSVNITYGKKSVSKSFWVKKSFRNQVAAKKNSAKRCVQNFENGNDGLTEAEMEEKWPRKKAYVSFANEIFVDEIKDFNDKSTGNQGNFNHDVTDLYKLISPRYRRGTFL